MVDLDDLDDEAIPEAETPDEAGDDGAAEAAADHDEPKKYRKVRWWTVITIPVLVGGAALAAWLFGDAWLTGFVEKSLNQRGMQLGEDSDLAAQLIGGKVELVDGVLIVTGDEETRTVYRSPRTAIDLAVIDTIASRDVIIDELRMQDAAIDFRRFPDGSIPLPETEEPAVEDEEPVTEEPPTDWLEMYESGRKWYDRVTRWAPSRDDGEPTQPVTEPEGWRQARRFHPTPEPGQAASALPRVLIRDLEISGDSFRFPDSDSEESPLDLVGFDFAGSNVTLRLHDDEQMTLAGSFTSRAAGAGVLDLLRDPDGDSSFELAWSEFPLPVAADPDIAGARFAAYRPSGTADIALAADWTREVLDGEILITLHDFDVDPEASTGDEGRQVDRLVDELRSAFAKLEQPFVVTWRIEIGGTPRDPELRGADAGAFVATLRQALQDAVEGRVDRALEEGRAEVDQVIREAQDDPEGAAENVEERVRNLGDRLGL